VFTKWATKIYPEPDEKTFYTLGKNVDIIMKCYRQQQALEAYMDVRC
jgi:hypothetical protein